MSFETVRYTPEWRASLVAARPRGNDAALRRRVHVVVRPEPGRRGDRLARRRRGRGRRRGGDELLQDDAGRRRARLAIPVNVATDSRYRGQGVFSTLRQRERGGCGGVRLAAHGDLPERESYPIFVRRLGWTDLPRLRLWARPLRVSGSRATCSAALVSTAGCVTRMRLRPRARGPSRRALRADLDELGAPAAGYGNHFSRDAAYFNWRYLDSPRDYRCSAPTAGASSPASAVVGHTFKHGVSAGFSPTSSRLRTRPGASACARRAPSRR